MQLNHVIVKLATKITNSRILIKKGNDCLNTLEKRIYWSYGFWNFNCMVFESLGAHVSSLSARVHTIKRFWVYYYSTKHHFTIIGVHNTSLNRISYTLSRTYFPQKTSFLLILDYGFRIGTRGIKEKPYVRECAAICLTKTLFSKANLFCHEVNYLFNALPDFYSDVKTL